MKIKLVVATGIIHLKVECILYWAFVILLIFKSGAVSEIKETYSRRKFSTYCSRGRISVTVKGKTAALPPWHVSNVLTALQSVMIVLPSSE